MRDEAIEALYRWFTESIDPRDDVIRALIAHPESLLRMRAAAREVAARKRMPRDLAADVAQQAVVSVLERADRYAIPYSDGGARAFSGWLWTLWHNACRWASRSVWPARERRVVLREPEWFTRKADRKETLSAEERHERAARLSIAVEGLRDERLRGVLVDCGSGLSARASSERRQMSEWAVYRLRRSGKECLREELARRGIVREE